MEPANTKAGSEISRKRLEDRLILRSWEDEEFRLSLLREPRAIIAREIEAMTGRPAQLPEQISIHIHEETPDELHFILPCRRDELAEDDHSLLVGWRKLLR